MPPTPDLSFTGLDKFINKPVVGKCKAKSSKEEPKVDCNYRQKQFQNQRMVKPVWNNAQTVIHHNFAKKTHPLLVNTTRQVNAAHSKTTVNAARSRSYLSKTAHSIVKMPIHKNTTFKNSNQRVNTVRDYEKIDRGYVAFGGNPKGGKITGKGTQFNSFVGTKVSDNAGQARKETELIKDYILLPLWTADPPFSQDPKSSHDDGSKPSNDDGKKVDEDP
nr:hypothetical protein [Tanacetum cinerariifolium]